MPAKKQKKPTVEEYIDMAVAKAVLAERMANEQRPKDIFKTTEKRLYAYPIIKAKIQDDWETARWYAEGNIPAKSTSITRFQKSGVRLSNGEIIEALIKDIEATIAADEYEIETLDRALEIIADDTHAKVITCLYFEGKTVAETGEAVHCDRSTVFRHKARLVQRLATYLYGVEAL